MVFPSGKSLAGTLCLALLISCNRNPAPHQAERERGKRAEAPAPPHSAPAVYRLDDNFARAAVDAPSVTSRLRMAEPIRWTWKEQKVTWDAVRGRIGFKQGQLIVKGEGPTPVIISPSDPLIDWSRYRTLRIRMIAEAGTEIKSSWGPGIEGHLAAPMQWGEYNFDLKSCAASFTKPMAIMPTDDLNAPVAIDYIELVPRESEFSTPAGVTEVGSAKSTAV